MSKMRSAMLQRRIDKERKRKLQEQEREETRRREAVHRMNAGMAKVFKEYIQKKQAELNSEQQLNKNMNKESLKKKLQAWEKLIKKDQKSRGDDDAWILAHEQDQQNQLNEDEKKALQDLKNNQMYDADELFYRILRVERMADRVKDFASPKDMAKILNDINAINNQLGNSRVMSRAPSSGSLSRASRGKI